MKLKIEGGPTWVRKLIGYELVIDRHITVNIKFVNGYWFALCKGLSGMGQHASILGPCETPQDALEKAGEWIKT